MILPEEFNYSYPKLYYNEKTKIYASKVDCSLFKKCKLQLGERLEHWNYNTYAYFESQDTFTSETQHECLSQFLQDEDMMQQQSSTIRRYITETVTIDFENYNEVINIGVEDTVLLHHIHLPHSEKDIVLGLEFECLWDSEHGLGIKIRDSKIFEVGIAEVAFGL